MPASSRTGGTGAYSVGAASRSRSVSATPQVVVAKLRRRTERVQGAAVGRALGQRPGRTTANMIIAIAMGGKAASSTPCQPQACSTRPALREPTADMPNTPKSWIVANYQFMTTIALVAATSWMARRCTAFIRVGVLSAAQHVQRRVARGCRSTGSVGRAHIRQSRRTSVAPTFPFPITNNSTTVDSSFPKSFNKFPQRQASVSQSVFNALHGNRDLKSSLRTAPTGKLYLF